MKPHPFRAIPFAFGLLFLAIAASWAAWSAGVIEPIDLRLVGPVAIIAIGLLGLAAALGSAKKEMS